MRRGHAFIAAFGISLAALPALADGPVVVELFTSQGCSSCPPADELLGELAAHQDVIALALHVDYWDYIGWADTFAQPAFTQRQEGYGQAAGSTVVYTPQMVVGGVDHVVGFRPMDVAELIMAHRAAADAVTVEATGSQGGGWRIHAAWTGTGAAPGMVVQLVTFSPLEEVEITHGENAGLSVDYHNIVRSWQVVGDWTGAAPFEAQITASTDLQHAVIVQTEGYGAILGAARLD
jgi:hypothetical protein